jgi:hypothetical protein
MNEVTSWKQALARLETAERNRVVDTALQLSAEYDDSVIRFMEPYILLLRNFGPVSALELAFKLYTFLKDRDAVHLLKGDDDG